VLFEEKQREKKANVTRINCERGQNSFYYNGAAAGAFALLVYARVPSKNFVNQRRNNQTRA
jgi:hypothetical protein